MTSRQSDDIDAEIEELEDAQETTAKSNSTTKLERRRRIEELDEERRLREELSAF